MRGMDGRDQQWVIYHDSAWKELVEQGYVTAIVETRHGQQWALMRYEPERRRAYPYAGY